MSRRFTLVPDDFWSAMQGFLALTTGDPAVITKTDRETVLFFAGTADVARAAPDGRGLACMRLLGSGVFHMDTEGYEGSVAHMARHVAAILKSHSFRIYEDETGQELTWEARARPALLFDVE